MYKRGDFGCDKTSKQGGVKRRPVETILLNRPSGVTADAATGSRPFSDAGTLFSW